MIEQVTTAPLESEAKVEVNPERAIEVVETELSAETIKEVETILLNCFKSYYDLQEVALKNVGVPPHTIFAPVIRAKAEVRKFLSHSMGRYFLAAIATDLWAMIYSDIANWEGVEDPEIVRDRIGTATEVELYDAVAICKTGKKKLIATLGDRVRNAAQAVLTRKEDTSKKNKPTRKSPKKPSQPSPVSESTYPVENSITTDQVRGWLLTDWFPSAIAVIKEGDLDLKDVISPEDLQAFSDRSPAKAKHVIQVLQCLGREDYLNIPPAPNSDQEEDILDDIGF